MIEIYLYGKLRYLVPASRADENTVIRVEPEGEESIQSLLKRAGVPFDKLYHIFLNGSLLATYNTMAPWLQYPQAQDDIGNWQRDVKIKPGDRIGLFGEDMAALVV